MRIFRAVGLIIIIVGLKINVFAAFETTLITAFSAANSILSTVSIPEKVYTVAKSTDSVSEKQKSYME